MGLDGSGGSRMPRFRAGDSYLGWREENSLLRSMGGPRHGSMGERLEQFES